MTDTEYSGTQAAILSIYQQLGMFNLDLGEFLRRLNTAHTVGPILDPTTYRDAMPNMRALADMAKALYPAYEVIEERRRAALEKEDAE